MNPPPWSKEELDRMTREHADAMGVSVEAYTEFLKAADETMTLAFQRLELNKYRAILGI